MIKRKSDLGVFEQFKDIILAILSVYNIIQ